MPNPRSGRILTALAILGVLMVPLAATAAAPLAEEPVRIDVRTVPFSCRGSYWCLTRFDGRSRPAKTIELHHVGAEGARDVVRIEPVVEGRVVEPEYHAVPERLRLRWQDASIDVAFENPRTLRLRGRGLGIRLTVKHPSVLLPVKAGQQRVVCQPPQGPVIMFVATVLTGSARVVNAAPDRPANQYDRLVIEVTPDAAGASEVALEEYLSEWRPRGYDTSFDACVRQRQQEFAAWLSKMPSLPERYQEAGRLAMYVNWSHLVEPRGFVRREGMLMSKTWMPHIWSWDHCFTAIATGTIDPRLAWEQLMVVFDHQDELGSLPDDIDSEVRRWLAPKVPVHGWTLREMMRSGSVTPAELAAVTEPLRRWTEFRVRYRDDSGTGLIQANSGNEAADNATVYDVGLPVLAPDLCALTAVQMDVLAQIARTQGDEERARTWTARADRLVERMLARLWTGDRFVYPTTYSGATNERAMSFLQCMPIVLGRRLPDGVRAHLVETIRRDLLTEHGIASESPRSPLYQSDGYWRGPIWAPVVHLMVTGLRDSGEDGLAREIARRFCETVRSGGPAENFDAVTGAPLRDPSYTWTSSVFLVLAHEYLAR